MSRLTVEQVAERRKHAALECPALWKVAENVLKHKIQEIWTHFELMKEADIPPEKVGYSSGPDVVASVAISMGLGRPFFVSSNGWFDHDCARYRNDLTDNLVHLGFWRKLAEMEASDAGTRGNKAGGRRARKAHQA